MNQINKKSVDKSFYFLNKKMRNLFEKVFKNFISKFKKFTASLYFFYLPSVALIGVKFDGNLILKTLLNSHLNKIIGF